MLPPALSKKILDVQPWSDSTEFRGIGRYPRLSNWDKAEHPNAHTVVFKYASIAMGKVRNNKLEIIQQSYTEHCEK